MEGFTLILFAFARHVFARSRRTQCVSVRELLGHPAIAQQHRHDMAYFPKSESCDGEHQVGILRERKDTRTLTTHTHTQCGTAQCRQRGKKHIYAECVYKIRAPRTSYRVVIFAAIASYL